MPFTHFDSEGRAIMVDVGDKPLTSRQAIATGYIRMSADCFAAVREGRAGKGDVLGAARIAGIMGAKKTPDLIPLCHPLLLTKVTLDFELCEDNREVSAVCTVKNNGQTGVEMEALTGVSVALLTVYDMCKALDKTMEIGGICLLEKTGGKSGTFINPNKVRD